MANANAMRNARNMRTSEYMQDKLIAGIDRRARENRADEDVMAKHHTDTNSEGERTWSF